MLSDNNKPSKNSNPKFVKEDDISEFFNLLIKHHVESKHEPVSSVFDSSHVTWCPRRLFYRASGVLPDRYEPFHADLATQKSFRDKWIDYFSKCKTIKVINQNVVASDCNYNIGGNVDAILKTKGIEIIAKFQAVNDCDFKKIIKRGVFKGHAVELIINMWLTDVDDGLLIYENKNTQEYKIFHVEQYYPIIVSIQEKCLKLFRDLINGNIPDRPYPSKSKECNKCLFCKMCWKQGETK